jgi:hypothetical protein
VTAFIGIYNTHIIGLKEVVATLQKKAQEKPRKTPLSSMAIAQFAQKIIII